MHVKCGKRAVWVLYTHNSCLRCFFQSHLGASPESFQPYQGFRNELSTKWIISVLSGVKFCALSKDNCAGEAEEHNDDAGQRGTPAHKRLINQQLWLCTCTSMGQMVTDVHQAVGTGIPQASKWLSLQLFPRWLCHQDVIVFEPSFPRLVIYEGPVVPSICLSLMDQDCMQTIGNLQSDMDIIQMCS